VPAATMKPMTGVVTRRWTDAGITWFAVGGVSTEQAGSAARLLMGYERHGDEWRIAYPASTPRLDQCWRNFSAHAQLMVRQAAGLEPVPWRDALRELCRRTAEAGVTWWLTGSTAIAVRGAPLAPGDLDLVCSAEDAIRLGDVFADELVEPVLPSATDWISDYWGRAFCGARIEWIGGPRSSADTPLPADFGPVAATRLEAVTWEGWTIRVPPLDLQRAVSLRRGLTGRVALIDSLVTDPGG
jgi:hypothetical protein